MAPTPPFAHSDFPAWCPAVPPGTRVLVIGATGGIGQSVVAMLLRGSDCVLGAHGATKRVSICEPRVFALQRAFEKEADCIAVIDEFCAHAGGIDALICLSGAIEASSHWQDMTEQDWRREIEVNLNQPFFLARAAMAHMKKQGSGGRIILNGTESALHGGSAVSFPYAVAKRGTECMVQGLAREGAPHGVLVNGVRFGCIRSGFHERWHGKTEAEMAQRISLIPLKRAGHPEEAAALIVYLLSGWAGFITGQMFALTGGDWL